MIQKKSFWVKLNEDTWCKKMLEHGRIYCKKWENFYWRRRPLFSHVNGFEPLRSIA